MMPRPTSLAWMFVALSAPACLAAHPIPEAERWATITHAGNAPHIVLGPTGLPYNQVGAVDHEYQISRTEVTGAEWFEFVQAYAPYVQEDAVNAFAFTSTSITIAGYRQYLLPAANADRPVEIGWHFAARYMNWLHNGKALTPAAFESGAYDTSTFGFNADNSFTDQVSHSPDARYWIPSVDEWIKAAHFDPDRYGDGVPGYWQYSNASDSPPAFGSPASGGGTSTGGRFNFPLPDVAAYPGTQSPWGLLDCSGGFSEWTEDAFYSEETGRPFARSIQGSSWRDRYSDSIMLHWDRIDGEQHASPVFLFGLRVARAVPGPGGVGVFFCALSFVMKRRRCSDEPLFSCRNLFDDVRLPRQ
ncbi:MAG: SUMF1/EgtB/PvdO family nonheme iron enzyme [Phycisphaerae bacterium]|nr:SUMF1/EgtB/PvdO family nonheme iron enzyme [Phycisphaerae bacterium]